MISAVVCLELILDSKESDHGKIAIIPVTMPDFHDSFLPYFLPRIISQIVDVKPDKKIIVFTIATISLVFYFHCS